jgi:hypothetical protein
MDVIEKVRALYDDNKDADFYSTTSRIYKKHGRPDLEALKVLLQNLSMVEVTHDFVEDLCTIHKKGADTSLLSEAHKTLDTLLIQVNTVPGSEGDAKKREWVNSELFGVYTRAAERGSVVASGAFLEMSKTIANIEEFKTVVATMKTCKMLKEIIYATEDEELKKIAKKQYKFYQHRENKKKPGRPLKKQKKGAALLSHTYSIGMTSRLTVTETKIGKFSDGTFRYKANNKWRNCGPKCMKIFTDRKERLDRFLVLVIDEHNESLKDFS